LLHRAAGPASYLDELRRAPEPYDANVDAAVHEIDERLCCATIRVRGRIPIQIAALHGFSKKAENHAHSVAIHFMHYNFVRIHQSLRITPAMAAGVTQTLWSLTDMVRVIEDWEAVRATKVSGETLVRKVRDATLVHSGFSSGAFPGWRVARSIRRAAPSGQNLTLGAGGWADDDPSQTRVDISSSIVTRHRCEIGRLERPG